MPNEPVKNKSHALRQVFARNIRMARIDKDMSQERLALDANLDRAFVGTLERGQRNISIDNIELLAAVVKLPAHELMNPDFAMNRGLDPSLNRKPRKQRASGSKLQDLAVDEVKPNKPVKPRY